MRPGEPTVLENASELLKNDYIKSAFENKEVLILKNNNIGADCIEERNF